MKATSSKVAELRYHPWGGTRFSSGTTPTARRYTGQIEDAAIGLYPSATSGQAFYNARYYDSYLSRFIQADTIVPSPANPQSLNRYAYNYNNPLGYIDPTGHWPELPDFQKLLSGAANLARNVLYNAGFPRIETGADGWKAEIGPKNFFYDINLEVGYKPAVRVGESPCLVNPEVVKRYSEDGQSWIGWGTQPLQLAQGNRISRISSGNDEKGATIQTEIRQISAVKIQDWKLNQEYGAEIAFSGKIPAVEGRSVFYMKFTQTTHTDRAAAVSAAAGALILGPKAWPAIPVIFERFAERGAPAFAQ